MWSCEWLSECVGGFFSCDSPTRVESSSSSPFMVTQCHVNGWRPIRWRAGANICTRCHKSPEQLWHVTVTFALPLTALVLFPSDQQQGLHSQDVLCATALQRVCVAQEEAAEERWTSVSCCVVTRWLRTSFVFTTLLVVPALKRCRWVVTPKATNTCRRASHRSDCPQLPPSSDPLGPAATVAALYLECWCNTCRTTMLSDMLLEALEIVAQKA